MFDFSLLPLFRNILIRDIAVINVQSVQQLLACEQDPREKERELATTSLEFEYLHRKSWCEMLIGGDDISNDVITLGTCLSMFVYIRTHFCPALIGGNQRGATGELEVEIKLQRRSCKLSFLFPPRRQSTPESLGLAAFVTSQMISSIPFWEIVGINKSNDAPNFQDNSSCYTSAYAKSEVLTMFVGFLPVCCCCCCCGC